MRLIVPFPPGGGTDNVGRILSARLSEIWGQQMVIENRGGGGSNVGSEAGAHAPPDGYTMLFAAFPFATNQFLYSKLPYDPVADFAPITLIGTFPNILVVPNTSPAKSVTEFIAHAKANRGDITFGSSGIGTSPHLNGELFLRMAGIEMTHIPLSRRRPRDHRSHPRPADHDVQHLGLADAACAVGAAARARRELGQALLRRAGAADRRRIRRAGLRRVVVVRAACSGQDAARDRAAR